MNTIVLSEKSGCKQLNHGDSVIATPLYSCCLIVIKLADDTAYAEHCSGTYLENLNPIFFSQNIVEAIMVTSQSSGHQREQAHWLQLQIPWVVLHYYESSLENGATPKIKFENGGIFLLAEQGYSLVAY